MGYLNDMKEALRTEKNLEPPEGYPHSKLRSFVSFVLPLMLIPLAVKGIQSVAKAVKESKTKKEDEKKK